MSVSRWFVHTVTVETFLGVGADGDVYATPVTLAPPNGCWVDASQKVVKNKDGIEVVSQTAVATACANAPLFTTGSRVTTGGVVSHVLHVNNGDSGSLNLPTDHLEVNLI